MKGEETEKFTLLLSNIHRKGNEGASLQEVMNLLMEELPKITMKKQPS